MTPISDIIDEPMPFHLARSRWGMEQSQMIGRIEWHIKQREQRLAQLPLIHYCFRNSASPIRSVYCIPPSPPTAVSMSIPVNTN